MIDWRHKITYTINGETVEQSGTVSPKKTFVLGSSHVLQSLCCCKQETKIELSQVGERSRSPTTQKLALSGQWEHWQGSLWQGLSFHSPGEEPQEECDMSGNWPR